MSTVTAITTQAPMSLHGETEGERMIERWNTFFKITNPNMSQEKKSLTAMAKFTQIALTNYIRFRKIYPGDVFVKRRFEKFVFYTLNTKKDRGSKLDEVIRSATTFILHGALKRFRFQIFHDSENPNEIGEELQFQFYYGREQRVELDFDGDTKLVLDMADCNFETFLGSFGETLARVRAYCDNLLPLPSACEKRFRASFCKKIPENLSTGLFDVASRSFKYAPNMKVKEIGKAGLHEVGGGTVLRTCYLSDEFEKHVEEQLPAMIQTQVSEILGGQGDANEGMEIPRQNQAGEEQLYPSSIAGSEFPPQMEQEEIPIQEEQRRPFFEGQQHEVIVSLSDGPQSPYNGSVVSMDAALSPFLRHETTHVVETTREDSNHDASGESSKEEDNSDGELLQEPPKKSSQSKPRRSTRKPATTSYAEQDSDEEKPSSSSEDPHEARRKKAPIKRKPNRVAIEKATQVAIAKKPRRTVK